MNFLTRAGVALAFLGWAIDLSAQDIQSHLARLESLLRQVEEGVNPCFSEQCQNRKSEALEKAFKIVDVIPFTGTRFLSSRFEALEDAQFMLRYPYQRPSENFPSTLNEWSGWWKRRYSRETNYRASWHNFQLETLTAYQSISRFLKVMATADENQITLINESWERKSGIISRLNRDQQIAYVEGRTEEMTEIQERRQKLEESFGNSFRLVMEEIFPTIEFKFIIIMQDYLLTFAEGFGAKQITDPQFLKSLSKIQKYLGKLNECIETYNDLEIGRLGLKNFHTSTNPLVAAELELNIQDFLDKVENRSRDIANIVGFYLISTATAAATTAKLTQIAIPSLTNLGLEFFDVDWTQKFLPRSIRSLQLDNSLEDLKEKTEERWISLLHVRKVLMSKISELKIQQGGNGS